MKRIFAVIIIVVTVGINVFGCSSEAELSGTYQSGKDYIVFKSNKKIALPGKDGEKEYSYTRKGDVLIVTDSRFVAPLEFTLQDDGSVTILTKKFVKN